MTRFIIRRLIGGVAVIWGIVTLVFIIGDALPINPAPIIPRPTPPASVVPSIYNQLGLNRPPPQRYLSYLWQLLHGNLGQSYATNQNVSQALMQRLPFTLELVTLSVIGELLIGVSLAMIAAAHRRSFWDGAASVTALSGLMLPSFWLALVLLYILGYRWSIFPLGGGSSPSWVGLPAFTLAFPGCAY